MKRRQLQFFLATTCGAAACLVARRAAACSTCDTSVGAQVRAAIFGQDFVQHLLWLIVPFGAFAVAALWVAGWFPRLLPQWRRQLGLASAGSSLGAGLLLGTGLGGFFDGIVFHQLLQTHNMLSARIFPDNLVAADVNMFWDGVFHALCYAFVALGVASLWRARNQARTTTRAFVGSILAGAGSFNFAEGLLDHQLLGLHHVIERAAAPWQLTWDLMFVASGAALLALGAYCMRHAVAVAAPDNVAATQGNDMDAAQPPRRSNVGR